MGTMNDKLRYISQTKKAIKDALVAKGVSVADTDTFRSYADKIGEIKGVSVYGDNDLTFHDYDGSILFSCSKEEAMALTELPELPVREGLVAQAWSMDLDKVKSTIESYGMCQVGVFYITDDERTRFYIDIANDIESYRTAAIYVGSDSAHEYEVDFGDGSDPVTVSATGKQYHTVKHYYASKGMKCISVKVVSGTLQLTDFSSDKNVMSNYYIGMYCLKKVELGKNVAFGYTPFNNCYGLETITFTKEFSGDFGVSCFENCYNLRHLCVNNAGVKGESFMNCYNLRTLILSNYGQRVTATDTDKYNGCSALEKVTCNHVTEIDESAFENCTNLRKAGISTQRVSSYAFRYCRALEDVSLEYVNGIIATSAFEGCNALSRIKMPNVTSIGASAFAGCYNLTVVDFTEAAAIPSLGTSVFGNSMCSFLVPPSLYDEWIVQTNWRDQINRIVTDVEPTECLEISITADDIKAYETSTRIYITARVNGHKVTTGEYVENVIYRRSIGSIGSFEKNTSPDAVAREVSYTLLGKTATTAIQQAGKVDYKIVCRYNVTDTSAATQLLYASYTAHTTEFSEMLVDGVAVPVALTYQFETTGEHEVAFRIKSEKGQISNPYQIFRSCTALTYADLTLCDMSTVTSTSSTAGTARMFNSCSSLKEVILPAAIAYLGYYMFYGCTNLTNLTIKAATAPSLYGQNTWGTSSYYIGYNTRSAGTNRLYVPVGSTGYTASGYSYLYSTSYCGFAREEVEL